MNPGSNFDNGSCQLWKLVPDADGWSRVQINGTENNSPPVIAADIELSDLLNGDDAAWQLWRFVPSQGGGWARLQIKCTGGAAQAPVAGGDERIRLERRYLRLV